MNPYLVTFLCLIAFLAGAWVQEKTRNWNVPMWMDEGEDE